MSALMRWSASHVTAKRGRVPRTRGDMILTTVPWGRLGIVNLAGGSG